MLIKLGFILGLLSYSYVDSSAKAALLVWELKLLREGRVTEAIEFHETELDGSILHHRRYREGIYDILAWPLNRNIDDYDYVQRVLNYRTLYPQDGDASTDVLGATDDLMYLEEAYSIKPHNKQGLGTALQPPQP